MTVIAPTGWTPSAERTAVWQPPGGVGRGVTVVRSTQVQPSWGSKSAADCLDFSLDPGPWLADTGDAISRLSGTITSADGSASPQDLVFGWLTLIAGCPVALLMGGVPGKAYVVILLISTRQGRRAAVPITITIDQPVAWLAPPPVTTGQPTLLELAMPDGTPIGIDASTPLAAVFPAYEAAAAGAAPISVPPNTLRQGSLMLADESGSPLVFA